jgi:hydrophobe/amphiphile efflux-1 (HAE1) family protein
MKITSGAIRKYPMIFAFMVIITVMGLDSYISLPRESAPDVTIPFINVVAPYPGTAPADMENLVTRKLERELKGLPDLKEMTSSSFYGMAIITMEFTDKVDMSDALQKVRDRVDVAKPELPEDTRDDLVIMEISASDWPIMQVNLAGDVDLFLLKKAGEDLQETLEQIPGVLSVDLFGGIENEVQVMVDPERLDFYGLGLPDVQDAIALQNLTIPGGRLALGQFDYKVRVPGEVEHVEEILDFVVNPGVEPPVYIRDVATVTFGIKDRETISRVNGHDAVTLSIKKRAGENIIDIADLVRTTLDEMAPTFPAGTEVSVVGDQSDDIRTMVHELENNIISGLILVVAVLFLFLGFTNSLFVGVAIPFSMLITFVIMRAFGMTLNMVALFSLILALGMLVDNAIVIVENIFRHRGQGKNSNDASRDGAHQVSAAVIASTLTTVCAFGPLAFWPGIMGGFMKWLPITVVITLVASLVVALVFNPVLCARFLRKPREGGGSTRLGDALMGFGLRTYQPTLEWALRHKAITLVSMVVLFIVMNVLYARFNHGVELFPDIDPNVAQVVIEAPSGTRIELTDAYTRQCEDQVAEIGDLVAYNASVGVAVNGMGTGDSAPSNKALVMMEFVDNIERSRSSVDALEELRGRVADVTGATVTVEKREEGPPTGKPVNIEISGHDFDVLGRLAKEIREEIRGIPGLVNIMDNYDNELPEIRVRADIEKAARYGLRTFDVASTIRTALHGSEVAKFRRGEDEYDITVRYQDGFRRKVEDLENATIFYEGKAVPVSAFATTEFTTSLAAVSRIDGQRVVTVSADAAAGYNGNALLAQVQDLLAEYDLPAGYHLDYTGESEDQEEAQAFLGDAFAVAIMLILLVLVSQFGSVTQPLIIIVSVMLSLIGVLAGLLVTGTAFGIIMTGVGVISLAGIVVNNAIVLLDYMNQLRERGLELEEAIVRAGLTRFRPVVLTAVTTILGLIPLTTGLSLDFARLMDGDLARFVVIGGESSQWWGPMGIAVIWGLAVATFLTLIVVPVMYASLEGAKLAFNRSHPEPRD